MPYDPQKHRRRSIRLKGYDYTQPGAYFVTLVTWNRQNLFGEITGGEMELNAAGNLVKSCWLRLPTSFAICLDKWVIMPNHFHGIIHIVAPRTGEAPAQNGPTTTKVQRADASPNRFCKEIITSTLSGMNQNDRAFALISPPIPIAGKRISCTGEASAQNDLAIPNLLRCTGEASAHKRSMLILKLMG